MKPKKAEKIVDAAIAQATETGEIDHLCSYLDSSSYSKRLKLQIIEVAKKHGLSLKLDEKRLLNPATNRMFTCNNIVKA